MTGDINQAVVDEILAGAEADTPEGRLEKLEKEVDTLKGSIKRLLMDIRVTMNNLENPFQNLQKLAEGALAPTTKPPQPIQVVPTPIQEPNEEKKEDEDLKKDEVEEKSDSSFEEETKKEDDPMLEVDEMVKVAPENGTRESSVESPRVLPVQKYDVITLLNLMEWVKKMLEKYDVALKDMIIVFESAGYITPEAKDLIVKLIDLVKLLELLRPDVDNISEDVVLELYKLHKMLYFQDKETSMDSKLLSLLLEKKS